MTEVDKDPWGRPYRVVMTRFKSQPIPAPTCPELLGGIVSTLFPRQVEVTYRVDREEGKIIPLITPEELMRACSRVGTSKKKPGLNGIPNVTLKTAFKIVPEAFMIYLIVVSEKGSFLSHGSGRN